MCSDQVGGAYGGRQLELCAMIRLGRCVCGAAVGAVCSDQVGGVYGGAAVGAVCNDQVGVVCLWGASWSFVQ